MASRGAHAGTMTLISFSLTVAMVLTPGIATAQSETHPASEQLVQGNHSPDVEAIAELHSISSSEAAKRIQAQAEVEDWAGQYADRVDYVEIQQDPYSVVVGISKVDVKLEIPKSFGSYAVVVEAARAPTGLIDELAELVDKTLGDQARYDLDKRKRSGEVVVTFSDPKVAEKLKATTSEIQALAPATLRIERVDESSLSAPAAKVNGGDWINGCTAGFATKDVDGEVTMMTAAHCPDSQNYASINMPFKRQQYSGSHDWQLNSGGGLHIRARMHDGSTDRAILSNFTGNAVVGANRCKYGRTTGYGCGTVSSVNFRPGYVPNGNATFITVHNQQGADLATPGDSGGPVMFGYTGYGIVSGTLNDIDLIYDAGKYTWDGGRNMLRSNDLIPEDTLTANVSRYSFDGRFQMVMQGDGNLVLYKNGGATWATSFYPGFSGVPNSRAVMQGDGNLVVITPSNTVTWAASWHGLSASSNSEAVVQNDGNFVLYSSTGAPKWATGTI